MHPAIPRVLPGFRLMVEDLGNPPAAGLADLLGVSERTVFRWLAADHAPRAPSLALFWLTRWGQSARECAAYNEARTAAGFRDAQAREIAALRHELARVVALGHFGSANAPTAREISRAVRSA